MKLSISTKRSVDDNTTTEHPTDESECAADLELILDWLRLSACRIRQSPAGIEKHRKILVERGESARRLGEIGHWRESTTFTEREKSALNLCEAMSARPSGEVAKEVLDEAKRHFNRTEMVRLSLAILAINDWIDAHANSPVHVLVVEDDPEDRDLLRWQLKIAQMEGNVIFVPDARQALAVLEDYRSGARQGELIALFLDLRLPGMDGLELLRRIRAFPEMEELPVMIMTSSSDPRDMEECRKLKVVSYVEKPITFHSFSKAIANIFHPAKGK